MNFPTLEMATKQVLFRPRVLAGNSYTKIETLLYIFQCLGTPQSNLDPGIMKIFPHWHDTFPAFPPKDFETLVPNFDNMGYDLLKVTKHNAYLYLLYSGVIMQYYLNC